MAESAERPGTPRPGFMLTLATVGFLLNFWAWALLSPLGPGLRERLELSYFAQSALVAVPVLVGSIGRVPVGALTDRYGARIMFPAVSLVTAVPVVTLAFVDSYAGLIAVGFVLGVGATAFAVGVPLISGWYPRARRGFALGIFGIGAAGATVANFSTGWLLRNWGDGTPFYVLAGLLVGFAGLAALLLRDRPRPVPAAGTLAAGATSVGRLIGAVLKLNVTWRLAALYAVSFGGFVAFSVYLPSYLRTAYNLNASDAGMLAAWFTLLAVAAWPVGGWLSDRLHPLPVLVWSFFVVAVLAIAQAFQPTLMPMGTIVFLGMAAFLGAAAGAVFALVGKVAPAGMVGTVTGVVGAAGGLGGLLPPLVMGAVYASRTSYTIGLLLLSIVALAAAVYANSMMVNVVRSRSVA